VQVINIYSKYTCKKPVEMPSSGMMLPEEEAAGRLPTGEKERLRGKWR
jgi:hypothetical protein